MTVNNDQPVYPLPQSYGKFDEESDTMEPQDLQENKRVTFVAYFIAFIVFQTGIILLFSLTILKVRTPKFWVRSATFETFEIGTNSFNLKMNTELGLKNNNFGDFKFEKSRIYFYYNGFPVGEAVVSESKVGIRATRRFNVVVNLISSSGDSHQLAKDLSSGILRLKIESNLSGKVELIKVLKKKNSAIMDCTLIISVPQKAHQINCR